MSCGTRKYCPDFGFSPRNLRDSGVSAVNISLKTLTEDSENAKKGQRISKQDIYLLCRHPR